MIPSHLRKNRKIKNIQHIAGQYDWVENKIREQIREF